MQASIIKKNVFYFRKFLRLFRVQNLGIIFLAQWLTAYFVIKWPLLQSVSVGGLAVPALACMSLSTMFIAAAGYLINDYYDIKIDYVNRPHSVLVGRVFPRRFVLFLHFLFNFIGVGLGMLISLKMAAFNFLMTFLLWFYSNHLKRKPLVGNVLVAVLSGMLLVQFVVLTQQSHKWVWFYSGFAFLTTLIREIVKDMEDRKGDAVFDSRTLPISWGIRKTHRLVLALSIVLLAALVGTMTWVSENRMVLYFLFLLLLTADFVKELRIADTKHAYARLSSKAKRLMVAGVLSMILL